MIKGLTWGEVFDVLIEHNTVEKGVCCRTGDTVQLCLVSGGETAVSHPLHQGGGPLCGRKLSVPVEIAHWECFEALPYVSSTAMFASRVRCMTNLGNGKREEGGAKLDCVTYVYDNRPRPCWWHWIIPRHQASYALFSVNHRDTTTYTLPIRKSSHAKSTTHSNWVEVASQNSVFPFNAMKAI